MLWESEAKEFGADLERVQVWAALSEFYLDTSQDVDDLQRIAQILARSPFSLEEMRHIEVYEVSPVCFGNLQAVAGEWAGFAPDWLIPRCLQKQQRNAFIPLSERPWLQRLSLRMIWSKIDWKRVVEIRENGNTPL